MVKPRKHPVPFACAEALAKVLIFVSFVSRQKKNT